MSEAEFQMQLTTGMLVCPLCGDLRIVKLPSAPRINLGAVQTAPATDSLATNSAVSAGRERTAALALQSGDAFQAHEDSQASDVSKLRAAMLEMAERVVANTEDVGDGFASEARKIHYGEAEERGIRGKATAKQARELVDEGIGVLPIPTLEQLKGSLH